MHNGQIGPPDSFAYLTRHPSNVDSQFSRNARRFAAPVELGLHSLGLLTVPLGL